LLRVCLFGFHPFGTRAFGQLHFVFQIDGECGLDSHSCNEYIFTLAMKTAITGMGLELKKAPSFRFGRTPHFLSAASTVYEKTGETVEACAENCKAGSLNEFVSAHGTSKGGML
jgi:hypothetical protein